MTMTMAMTSKFGRIDYEVSPCQPTPGSHDHDVYACMRVGRLRKMIASCYKDARGFWRIRGNTKFQTWASMPDVCASLRRPYGIAWAKDEWDPTTLKPPAELSHDHDEHVAWLVRALPSSQAIIGVQARAIREVARARYFDVIVPLDMAMHPKRGYIRCETPQRYAYGFDDEPPVGHAADVGKAVEQIKCILEADLDAIVDAAGAPGGEQAPGP